MIKSFKCPFCNKRYVEKQSLYTHMEKEHKEQLNELSPAQVYFNMKYNKTGGNCIICKKPTTFNENTEKYNRLCDNPKCKESYRKMFLERMKKRPDWDLKDENIQKRMLQNRKISGTYTWSKEPHTKFNYTGTYEKDFLKFMDLFLDWNPQDIFAPSLVTFKYNYNGKEHVYIPDFYLDSYKLIIEVKSFTNEHYRKRDIEQEKAKDKVVNDSKYNYFKVHDKYYDDFFDFLIKLKNKE